VLGIAIVVAMVVEAIGLMRSEFVNSSGIWASLLLGAGIGVGAIVFGVRTRAMDSWVKGLGYALCLVLSAYTLYILLITPTDALWRPFLAVQICVLLLSAGTVFYLARSHAKGPTNT
jgi:hypothetical protein